MSPISPGSLLIETRRLLKEDERTLLDIHKATGLPFDWLRKLSSGDTADPSVNRIQHLYEHLKGSKLKLN